MAMGAISPVWIASTTCEGVFLASTLRDGAPP